MKKRAISLFLVVSMSFTLFYPKLSLNDNVVKYVGEEELAEELESMGVDEHTMIQILRMPRNEKKYKIRLLEWFSEICR